MNRWIDELLLIPYIHTSFYLNIHLSSHSYIYLFIHSSIYPSSIHHSYIHITNILTSLWLYWQARCNGVKNSSFVGTFLAAPCSRSASTICLWPRRAALWSGVLPTASQVLTVSDKRGCPWNNRWVIKNDWEIQIIFSYFSQFGTFFTLTKRMTKLLWWSIRCFLSSWFLPSKQILNLWKHVIWLVGLTKWYHGLPSQNHYPQ